MKEAVKDNAKLIPELQWVESVSKLLDAQFNLPGTKFKFGLDPILGLIPGVGDISTMAISMGLIYTMAKRGVSRKVIILMTLNVLLDTVVGAIPILGSIFDFAYKSNTKNINLLKKHYGEGKYEGRGTGIIIGIMLLFLLVFSAVIFGMYKLVAYLIHLF